MDAVAFTAGAEPGYIVGAQNLELHPVLVD